MKKTLFILGVIAVMLLGCKEEQFDITSISRTEVTIDGTTAEFFIYVTDQDGGYSLATIAEYGVYLSSDHTTPDEDDTVILIQRTDDNKIDISNT